MSNVGHPPATPIPDRPRAGEVKRRRRQWPQDLALVRELKDRETAGRVEAPVADRVAPADVLLVEFSQAAEPPGRPEARLRCRTPPSTEPDSRGVSGVRACA
jgi:hypothetical protein